MPIQGDDNLAYQIEQAIGKLPGVNLSDLRVDVDRGRARIQGVVRQLADKQAAIEAAFRIPGILAVDEAIAVETPQMETDLHLSRALDEAMDEEEEVDAHRVGAGAVRGQAILQGETRGLAELTRAYEAAESVPNTTNVIDSSRIQNPYGPDQTDLANVVANALAGHPVLHLRPIRALVEGTGRLVLRGEVRSSAEREEALAIAAGVPGVHTVREELEVVP